MSFFTIYKGISFYKVKSKRIKKVGVMVPIFVKLLKIKENWLKIEII